MAQKVFIMLCNKWLVRYMGCIFLAILFLARNEKFVVISREKQEKMRRKSYLKIAFSLTNFAENFNFWLVKISGQGFSSVFAKSFKVECSALTTLWNFEKSSKITKIWPKIDKKMKKIHFLVSCPQFLANK